MQKLLAAALVFVHAALVTGCLKYQPLDVNPVKSESELRSRTAPNVLDLESLTAAAAANSGDVAVARARLAEAEAGLITARQRVNPSLSGEGGYNRTPESVSTYSSAMAFTIETAGKRGYRILAAQKNLEAARIAVAEAEWQARSRARAALVKYHFAEARLASFRSEKDLRAEIATMFERRLALGESSRPELNSARADQASAEIALKNAAGEAARSLAELASAVAIPVAALEGRQIDLSSLETPLELARLPLSKVERAGLLHRADIRRTLAEYDAADARLRLELANQYPNVTLSPAYTFQEGFPAYTLGAALDSLPILHRREGPVAEADAARREVRARFLALQAQAIGDSETALRQYSAAMTEWIATRDSLLGTQQRRERATEISFRAGETDRLDATQSRLATIGAERAVLDASERIQKALGALEDSVQSILNPEPQR